jgi:hypothetical protein
VVDARHFEGPTTIERKVTMTRFNISTLSMVQEILVRFQVSGTALAAGVTRRTNSRWQAPFRSPISRTVLTLILCFCGSGLVTAGELDPQQHEWHQHYKKQPNAPKPEEMLLNTDAEPDVADGFTSLFNGKDLTTTIALTRRLIIPD